MNRLSDEKKKKKEMQGLPFMIVVFTLLNSREITFTPLILFGLLNEGCTCNDVVLFI